MDGVSISNRYEQMNEYHENKRINDLCPCRASDGPLLTFLRDEKLINLKMKITINIPNHQSGGGVSSLVTAVLEDEVTPSSLRTTIQINISGNGNKLEVMMETKLILEND